MLDYLLLGIGLLILVGTFIVQVVSDKIPSWVPLLGVGLAFACFATVGALWFWQPKGDEALWAAQDRGDALRSELNKTHTTIGRLEDKIQRLDAELKSAEVAKTQLSDKIERLTSPDASPSDPIAFLLGNRSFVDIPEQNKGRMYMSTGARQKYGNNAYVNTFKSVSDSNKTERVMFSKNGTVAQILPSEATPPVESS